MNKQQGQIIIIAAVFMIVVIALVVGLVGYAGVQIKSHRQAVGRVQGLSIAEAAIELAVWKLNNTPGYTGETGTAYGNGTFNITVTNSGADKIIKAESFVPDATSPRAKRTVQVTAKVGTTNVAFNYGVHVGAGGIKMDNNSKITGNIFANGNIIGDNTGVKIAGTAVAAGATGRIEEIADIDGNATAHFLEDILVDGNTNSVSLIDGDVGGNVVSDSIEDCDIDGNATYDTKTNPCTITGSQTTPNPADFVDPSAEALPITDQQVADWEDEAEDEGEITSQTIDGNVSLGPKKINGNLTLNNGSVLTVTGTLWVTGQITLNQGSTLELDASYGGLSGVVIAGTSGSSTAGFIDVQNGASIEGSGTAGSYLMLLSQRNNAIDDAIFVKNQAAGAIFYAGYGVIEVSNTGRAKELTAYKIHLNQNAIITYESGLANANFSSGPGGGWEVLSGTWQLLQ